MEFSLTLRAPRFMREGYAGHSTTSIANVCAGDEPFPLWLLAFGLYALIPRALGARLWRCFQEFEQHLIPAVFVRSLSALRLRFQLARHLYEPVGKCIYCGETELPTDIHRFGDEHIIPFALGGNLILPEASCKHCEKIINRQIETPVSSHEWGFFRSKRTFPTRRKKRRKTHIKLRSVDGGSLNVPVSNYSAPVFLYKFGEARILTSLPPGTDHLRWTVVVLTDHDAEMTMQHKYPEWDKRHHLKAQPHEFARLLAKIAYGYVVAELGIDTFNPLVLDIILGKSDDYFYAVGGTWDIEPVVPNGDHITDIRIEFVSPYHAQIIVDIRLFSATGTPSYHVVVGLIDLKNPEHVRAFEKHRLEGKIKTLPLREG